MMEKLNKRGEELAKDAQRRKVRELARHVSARLPQAEIKLLTDRFTIRDLRILDQWLDDPELRFLGSIKR